MNVEHILSRKGRDVASISPLASVLDAAQMLDERGIGALLVRDNDGFIKGIISERDVVRGLARRGADSAGAPVSALMTRDVVFCDPFDTLTHVMGLMTERRIRHVPVVRDNHLVGIISIGDIVKHRIEEIEQEAETLKAYIAAG